MIMYGLKGYQEVIGKQIRIGNMLRQLLSDHGWSITNNSPLPVICFTDDHFINDSGFARAVCDHIVKSGEAWISVYPINGREVLRACITNYNTDEQHIEKLMEALDEARRIKGDNKHLINK